ncbi:putative J domain-containing protein [Seiridium cardinale]|uniref:J domain-containing protein n=1 Tax=Seiridium cardinale TaxID=138064 RepID=A0ABR2XM79_9PEZI
MPKVDATRNYYADLQVTPSAPADEVKKQYRKLAMQWHPDRNRGREEEASKKFQVIQAAFEILTDPTLKRQYDEARNKANSRFPTSSGVRGNPWANAGSDFPPPPKRSGANTGTGSGTQPRPPPGAARYSNWSTRTPRASTASQKNDPSSAKAHYEAWTNMRNNTNPNAQRKPPPTPGRPPTSAARESKTSGSEGIPRTNSQRQKAQDSFGNSARRTGFTPRSPGPGDEPPVTNNNYFTTRTRTNIFPDEPASTTRQNHRASAAPDPLAQFRDSFMDGRHSAPYATPGGEKTSLFGDGLNRAKSTRESGRDSGKEDADTSFPFPRQRSSSTPRSSSNDGGSEDSTKANAGVKSESRKAPTNSTPSTRFSDRYRPKSAETTQGSEGSGQASTTSKPNRTYSRIRETNYSLTGEAFAKNGIPNQSAGGPSKYATPPCTTSAEHFCPTTLLQPAKSLRANTAARAAAKLYRDDASSGAAEIDSSSLSPFEQVLRYNLDRVIRKKQLSTQEAEEIRVQERKEYPSLDSNLRGGIDDNTNTYDSFGFPADPSTPGKRFASSSAENISTKFVDEQPEAWEFTAGGPSTVESHVPFTSRSQSGSRLGRQPSSKFNRRPVPPIPGANPAAPTNVAPEGTSTAGFSAAQWGEKIGSEHFVPQPSTSASASPTRRASSRKNSKPVKVTRGGSAGIVDEDDEIPTTTAGWQDVPKPPSGTQSPMAMDIDTPPIDKDSEALKRSQAHSARKIPVEPTRPEWRAGDANGNAEAPTQRPTLSTDAAGTTASPSKSAPSTANPFAIHNGGSEDSEEFRANFSDFKKVEPFTDPQPTGLQSFADLKTTLPFESRASAQIPLERAEPTPHLEFPTAPVAPRLPPTMAVPGLRPNNTQWRKYAQDFYNYMEKWEAFNDKVLTHFAARQQEMKQRRQQVGRAWLEGAHGMDGASLYQAELEQDHDVRKQWMRTCDEHQSRVREFVTFRDRAK